MPVSGQEMPTLAESRAALLEAIGPAPDITFIRPYGNLGDALIWAGARELLRDRIHREISIEDASSAQGELALISGGGGWSRSYNEFMPELLAIAERRFERVIVLPSTFEVAEDRTRAALERTSATVFAREPESFRRIRGLCRAGLAHDLAFFVDLSAYASPGSGELNAFRLDPERPAGEIPADNVDLPDVAESLESFLEAISRHAVVNTNRAHVMIAAALMGKRVNYSPTDHFKVDALAESSLGDYDVHRIPSAADRPAPVAGRHRPRPGARVSIAVISHDQPDDLAAAVGSATAVGDLAAVTVFDRNSRARTRAALDDIAARHPEVAIRRADSDGGGGAARRLAAELADGEYLLFLRGDMRLADGALERMVSVLDAEPDALAVAPEVVSDGGRAMHCGGWIVADRECVRLEPGTAGSGGAETGWVPPHGTLFRRTALEEIPLASGLDTQLQSLDWCLRAAEARPGSLRRSPGAVVTVAERPAAIPVSGFLPRAAAARRLPAHARFLALHDRLVPGELIALVPELAGADDELRAGAARLLLGLVAHHGHDWLLMEWMNGGLAPLLGDPELITPELRERIDWLERRNEMLSGIESGGWWRLRERTLPIRRAIGGNGAGDGARDANALELP